MPAEIGVRLLDSPLGPPRLSLKFFLAQGKLPVRFIDGLGDHIGIASYCLDLIHHEFFYLSCPDIGLGRRTFRVQNCQSLGSLLRL